MTTQPTPPLDELSVRPDPLEQFALWYADAEAAAIHLPMAMTLATATADGAPSARIVLLKQSDERGFIFYTNYRSRKGRELAGNPRAALVFFWDALDRQVRAEGTITKVAPEESDRYFATRPRESQLGAHVSPQSEPITSRVLLDESAKTLERRFDGRPVPRPAHWGGFCLVPSTVEFWQGRPGRLHDRIAYTRAARGWSITRLAP
jgi:pyridoxamine 5'-phosphate oxidase